MKCAWFAGAAAAVISVSSPAPSLATSEPPGGQSEFQETLAIPVLHHHHQHQQSYRSSWPNYGPYANRKSYVPETLPRSNYPRWYDSKHRHGIERGDSYWNYNWLR